MTTKKKGIAVVSDSGDVAFKFLDDGTSVLGKDENSVHSFKGSVNVSGEINVKGNLVMDKRIGGYKFGLPELDGQNDEDVLNALNSPPVGQEDMYNGFMFYLNNNALTSAPFDQPNKIYFCEDGVWHPSPFFATKEEES